MKVAILIARVLLGLMFVVFGLNAFLHFMPMPEMPDNNASRFIKAMLESGYFYPIAILEMAGGALLLLGRHAPLGLTLLGPVIVNIVLFHIFLDRSGMGMAAFVAALALFLLWAYRSAFARVVQPFTPSPIQS